MPRRNHPQGRRERLRYWPAPAQLDGAPLAAGDRVRHATHGAGVVQWCEWRTEDGAWIDPTTRWGRDVRHGAWHAVVRFGSTDYLDTRTLRVAELTREKVDA